MDVITDELLVMIANSYFDMFDDLNTCLRAMYICYLVCLRWTNVFSEESLWKNICKKCPDYVRLLRRHRATSLTWKIICKEHLSNVIVERLILVGDRLAPEQKILLHVRGDGQLFAGMSDIYVFQMGEYETKYDDVTYDMIPYAVVSEDFKLERFVADLASFDPFVLVLTADGRVIELAFLAAGVEGWNGITRPRQIYFNSGSSDRVIIDKVYAFAHSNFALQDGNVWCWTIVDHPFPLEALPEERGGIKTRPLLLTRLKQFWIYHIEYPPASEITRMYYLPRETHSIDELREIRDVVDTEEKLYLDVPNRDLMFLMSSTVFTEDQLEYYAQRMARGAQPPLDPL